MGGGAGRAGLERVQGGQGGRGSRKDLCAYMAVVGCPHTFSSNVAAAILPILLFIRVHWSSEFPTQLNLCLPLQTTNVLYRQSHPLILPRPCLAVGSQHDSPQGIVMNEPLHFGLHPPVLELHLKDIEGIWIPAHTYLRTHVTG